MNSHNREYREDLREHGECRDCEAPLLASERNFSRCSVCRAKCNAAKAEKRGDSPAAVEAAHDKVRAAVQARIQIIGRNDGAGDRWAVRRRRRAA